MSSSTVYSISSPVCESYLGRPSKEDFQPLPSFSSTDLPASWPPASRRTVAFSAAGPTHFLTTGTSTFAVEVLVTVKPPRPSGSTAES